MADYTIDKIHYGSDTYLLKDSHALYLTNEGNLKIDGTIAADQGIFNKLIATTADIGTLDVDNLTAQNATVVGLLDVKGEMHTNSWTNANIANIGGSFYITPTIESPTATLTIEGNKGNRTIIVTNGTFETNTIQKYENETVSPVLWVEGSKVMITGSVQKNNSMEYPLGTCTGILSAELTTTGFTIQSINSNALEEIIATLGTSLTGIKIKLSMYEVGPSNAYKPIGILLTSYGVDKSTYIDIYGGVNSKETIIYYNSTEDKIYNAEKTYYTLNNNIYTEFTGTSFESGISYYERFSLENYTNPNVRLGYLGNIPAYIDSTDNIHQPTGWGIYTDNGYFKGVVVADSGSIGGFIIGNNELYSQGKTNVKSTDLGTYMGPDGFNISGGNDLNTTFFTEDEVSIGGLLKWKAALGNEKSNLTITANEIIVGELGEALILPNLDFLKNANKEDNFTIKTLLTNALLEISDNKSRTGENEKNIGNLMKKFNNYYEPYINSIDNTENGPYYIEFKHKALDSASSIKITDATIEISINQQNITTFEENLMRTTFGEFENLRMKAKDYTNNSGYLTWIARSSNGHLSLKVVK